jgi:hypothetical protein
MNRAKAIFILVVLVLGAATSASGLAQHRGGGYRGGAYHGGGYYGGGYYGGRYYGGGYARFGVFIGPGYWNSPFYYGYPPYYAYSPYYPYPSYAYPPYYYPQLAVAPVSPPTYVEQGGAQPAPAQPPGFWYYCGGSNGYYPYVKECPGGWQQVAPLPSN